MKPKRAISNVVERVHAAAIRRKGEVKQIPFDLEQVKDRFREAFEIYQVEEIIVDLLLWAAADDSAPPADWTEVGITDEVQSYHRVLEPGKYNVNGFFMAPPSVEFTTPPFDYGLFREAIKKNLASWQLEALPDPSRPATHTVLQPSAYHTYVARFGQASADNGGLVRGTSE